MEDVARRYGSKDLGTWYSQMMLHWSRIWHKKHLPCIQYICHTVITYFFFIGFTQLKNKGDTSPLGIVSKLKAPNKKAHLTYVKYCWKQYPVSNWLRTKNLRFLYLHCSQANVTLSKSYMCPFFRWWSTTSNFCTCGMHCLRNAPYAFLEECMDDVWRGTLSFFSFLTVEQS